MTADGGIKTGNGKGRAGLLEALQPALDLCNYTPETVKTSGERPNLVSAHYFIFT